MTVPNQISHRASYFERQAKGKVGQGMMGPTRGKRRVPAPQAPEPTVGDAGQKPSLAEQLGMTDLLPKPSVEPDEPNEERAQGLPPLAPPVTANVPETAEPETIIDPPQGDVPEPAVQWGEPPEEDDEEEEQPRPLI
jgi:hypothetical protein